VAGGADPAALLHELLGTGTAAQVLGVVYLLFFAFIPVALAAALVFLDLRRGLFVATALSAAWLLGALSYLILPAIGPFHADPATYGGLAETPVAHMQARLMGGRAAFLHAPGAPGAAQSIGAFASLHTAFCGTAAIAAHLVGARRPVRAAVWLFTALTVTATVYFGWHYLLDDVAGVAIAVISVLLAAWGTGRFSRPAATREEGTVREGADDRALVPRFRRRPEPSPSTT
jgi:membrane-associated phospholipid phosphatase